MEVWAEIFVSLNPRSSARMTMMLGYSAEKTADWRQQERKKFRRTQRMWVFGNAASDWKSQANICDPGD
jgi:hypothetical protein